jgi:hypothetical protein
MERIEFPSTRSLTTIKHLVFRREHFAKGELMSFGEGLAALRATETAQSIPMFSKALSINLACAASHCLCDLLFIHRYGYFTANVRCFKVENRSSCVRLIFASWMRVR